eukprot:TRINITY_DN31592_c0_g1_i1.p1 TRINITY_DN31592_c0_g1~~TRINITY_DN31592_c0_g1_i1.p1  ORF type:complete len:462 (+),score=85.54 TRINITY_DN31592_c0_g1_i1:38-1387(+)
MEVVLMQEEGKLRRSSSSNGKAAVLFPLLGLGVATASTKAFASSLHGLSCRDGSLRKASLASSSRAAVTVVPRDSGSCYSRSIVGSLVGGIWALQRRRRPDRKKLQFSSRNSNSVLRLNALGAGIKILGTGSAAPESRVTNDHLSEVVDTDDAWITQRTGIKSRHVLKTDERLGSLAQLAAERALESAGMSAEDIDLVILATSTPDDIFGSGPEVAAKLGATKAVAFDLTAACSGFVFSLVTAAQYVRSGAYKSALVIGADSLSRFVDWTDRGTCVLFGDGAGAVVITATEPENDALIGFELGSDGKGKCHLGVDATVEPVNLGGGNTGGKSTYQPLFMNGKEVFRFATTRVPEVLVTLLERHEIPFEDVDWLLLHQANRRIMSSAAKRLGLPEEKIICNLDEYGNTSAASIPLALDEAVRSGKVKPGELIACAGFGAGLSWGGMLLRL